MAEKWEQLTQPPAPMFFNKKERDFVKQITDEVSERVLGQQFIYFPIDMESSNYDDLYGEAINKSFLSPIRIYAFVQWEGFETVTTHLGTERKPSINIGFHSRRIHEDQDLEVRVGDFIKYGNIFYEITSIDHPSKLFGQVEHEYEIIAKCIKARKGLFDGE